jgi:hypothetical protein
MNMALRNSSSHFEGTDSWTLSDEEVIPHLHGRCTAIRRHNVQRCSREAHEANMVPVDMVKAAADRKGATPTQVALAWLLAQKPWGCTNFQRPRNYLACRKTLVH